MNLQMERRSVLKHLSFVGISAVTGCLGENQPSNSTSPTATQTQRPNTAQETSTHPDDEAERHIGIQIDNQLSQRLDVSVGISSYSGSVDELNVSVEGGEVTTVESAISSRGEYELGVTVDNRSTTISHSVSRYHLRYERAIVIVISEDRIRSYIQE